jgi:2-polyprenyl-3-methyl-5-hydroxy-6-metoxy-1,4-benzoquinol methylase
MLDCARSAGFITAGNELAVGAVEAAAGRGHDVRLGSLADVGFRRKFDVVSLIEVIEHVPCPRQVVEEAVAHMETDGHLFLTTPNVGSISRRTLGLRWSGVAAPEHLQLFSRRGLHYMLAASNVTPSRCATTGLNLHELRRRAAMAPSTLACERVAAAYALNASLSTTATRRAVKSAANQLLTVLGVGDTIKVTAIR